jgi:hydroxyethylthiazole kinase-like uncharacterized protein yjeF
MLEAHDVGAIRRAEEALLTTLAPGAGGALMQRAATGLAVACARALGGTLGRVAGARVVVLAGSGNNGGDALYAGAQLARRGARVDAVLLGSRVHEEALATLRHAGGRVETGGDSGGPAVTGSHAGATALLERADLVLDGIVGIGGGGNHRGLRPDAAALVARAEASRGLVVAVDVPSGVDASTGEVDGETVHADLTVTFGATKPGLLIDPGARHAGAVTLVHIGLGPHLPARAAAEVLETDDVAALLPAPGAESDKYARGVVGVVAGSEAYPGAAVLCAGGAVRAGAGMVRYVGPPAATDLVHARWPEVVAGVGRVQAWTVGSGLGEGADAAQRAATALDSYVPVVVDADGLRHLDEARRRPAPTLLTPHAGELARLLDVERTEVESHRLDFARRAAERFGATVLLKGSTTVVAAPDGRVRVNTTATSWLATAGTGDVLAGACGALLAGGLDPLDAGSVGAYLHGLAGRLASEGGPISARDVLAALPRAWRATLHGGEPR